MHDERIGCAEAPMPETKVSPQWFNWILEEVETAVFEAAVYCSDFDASELTQEQVAEMRGHLRAALRAAGVQPDTEERFGQACCGPSLIVNRDDN